MSRVTPSYERFMAAFPTLDALAAASAGAVIRVWAGIGYNQRAVRLQRAARQIAVTGWPRSAGDLMKIDGIGPFTAAIVASFAFGEATGCVDTNVRRVLGRLVGEGAIGTRPLQALADATLSTTEPGRWNQALMDYGALVCGVRPKCGECVVSAWCESRGRFAGGELRVAEPRATYGAPRHKREGPFSGSTRYYRGRIVDALRALPAGRSLSEIELAARIANDGDAPSVAATRELVEGLERDGLATVARGRVSLPD
jgi:A/G-specific adenine glycosylase